MTRKASTTIEFTPPPIVRRNFSDEEVQQITEIVKDMEENSPTLRKAYCFGEGKESYCLNVTDDVWDVREQNPEESEFMRKLTYFDNNPEHPEHVLVVAFLQIPNGGVEEIGNSTANWKVDTTRLAYPLDQGAMLMAFLENGGLKQEFTEEPQDVLVVSLRGGLLSGYFSLLPYNFNVTTIETDALSEKVAREMFAFRSHSRSNLTIMYEPWRLHQFTWTQTTFDCVIVNTLWGIYGFTDSSNIRVLQQVVRPKTGHIVVAVGSTNERTQQLYRDFFLAYFPSCDGILLSSGDRFVVCSNNEVWTAKEGLDAANAFATRHRIGEQLKVVDLTGL